MTLRCRLAQLMVCVLASASSSQAADNPYPRRVLAISINDYLFANPLQYGINRAEKEDERRDFYKVVERFAARWNVPGEQTFFVTDGPLAHGKIDKKHPPLRPVVTGAIERFLDTSRAQDRLVIIFAGHALEKDGQAYLVPLEGELDELSTLTPLKDVYAKIAKCPAQEKLIIFDVYRYDPERGFERPAMKDGMTEALEKALHDCPDGTTVWTSCSAGQFSHEYEYSQVDIRGLRKFEMYGSIFLNMFYALELRGRRNAAPQLAKQTPSDPLPIAPLSKFVNEMTCLVVRDLEKKEQAPKVTSKAARKAVAYDPKEALAKTFEPPEPPMAAKWDQIVAICRELKLGPARGLLSLDAKESWSPLNFPFAAAALKSYADGGPTFEEIWRAPERYAEGHPLRVAAMKSLDLMRQLQVEAERHDEAPWEFRSPIKDEMKKLITDKYQRPLADRIAKLQEAKDQLAAAGTKRDAEKSKRWLAHFDFASAQVKMRLAYLSEYNLALSNVRSGVLPQLRRERSEIGWKLASSEKMASPKAVRDWAEEARKGFAQIAKDHPGTPWAVLAKMQQHTQLGLRWQPSTFGAE